jgi:glycosyltransferase domain-containing protein
MSDNSNKFLKLTTLLLVTKDRKKNLNQFIEYWSNIDVKIIIADGSQEPYTGLLKKNIKYIYNKDGPKIQRLIDAGKNIKTKYFMFCADDDFLSINGLIKNIEFLERNNSYSGCQGKFLLTYGEENNQPYLMDHSYGFADKKHIESQNILNRLIEINSYPIMFYCWGLFKSSVFLNFSQLVKGAENIKFSEVLFEPMVAFATAIDGKFKTLPHLHIIRRPSNPYHISYQGFIYFHDLIKKKDKLVKLIAKNLSNILCETQSSQSKEIGMTILNVYLSGNNARLRYPQRMAVKVDVLKRIYLKIYRFFSKFGLNNGYAIDKNIFNSIVTCEETKVEWLLIRKKIITLNNKYK